jgi:N-methylhydantoinase B
MVDPITLEVMSYRLGETVSMMEHLLFHSGYSPILRESYDGSACILDRDGQVVVGSGAPYHLFPYHRTTQSVIAKFGDNMRPGDSFLINDPYTSGNFHVPDVAIVTPVFYKGERVAFCASIAHKPDLGGLVPGSSGAGSREIFHEGVLYPGVRIWSEEGINKDIESMLRSNSRAPEEVVGDVRAQVGCTKSGAVRMQEMCDDYGSSILLEGFAKLMKLSENRLRRELAALPDGISEAEAFLDNDGVDLDKPIRIHVKVTKHGDTIEFDYSGCDPQVKGPVNVRPQSAESGSVLALIGIIDPTIPINDGVRRAVTFINPEGRVSHARYPAPVNNYYPTTHLMYSCVQKAMAHFSTRRVVAPAGFGIGGNTLGYTRSRSGKPAVQYELQNTSLGGTDGCDGSFGTIAMNHITPNTPVEILESEYPLLVTCWEPNPDTAGAGEHRGGLGYIREYKLLDEAKLTIRMGQFKFGSWGVNGGKGSRTARVSLNPGKEHEEKLPPLTTRDLQAGDVVRIETAGGGGCGHPFKRDPQSVLSDVKNGYVTLEASLKDYGVSIDRNSMTINELETNRLRLAEA